MNVVRPPLQAMVLAAIEAVVVVVAIWVLSAPSGWGRSLGIGIAVVLLVGAICVNALVSLSRLSREGTKARIRNGLRSLSVALPDAQLETTEKSATDLGLGWTWRLVRARNVGGFRVNDQFIPVLVLSTFGPRLGRGLTASHFERESRRKQDIVRAWTGET